MSEELGYGPELPPPGAERLAALIADNTWRTETGNDSWLWCVDETCEHVMIPHGDHSIGRRRANRGLKKKRGRGRYS